MKTRERAVAARGGFTLMELLIVVAILVVLAGAAVPLYMRYLEGAKASMAWTNAKTLEKVCETYRIQNGDYPASLMELAQPSSGKPYIEAKDLKDPWGQDFMYAHPGSHSTIGKPDIWSNGAPGTNDPNGQIGNWLAKPPN